MGRGVGEERLANDWVGLGVCSEWNWSKKKKKSLRVQVESPIYLLLFTTKDLGNGRL